MALARNACRGTAAARILVWTLGGHHVTGTSKRAAEARLREMGARPLVLERAGARAPRKRRLAEPCGAGLDMEGGDRDHHHQDTQIDRMDDYTDRHLDQLHQLGDLHDGNGQLSMEGVHGWQEDPFGHSGLDLDNMPIQPIDVTPETGGQDGRQEHLPPKRRRIQVEDESGQADTTQQAVDALGHDGAWGERRDHGEAELDVSQAEPKRRRLLGKTKPEHTVYAQLQLVQHAGAEEPSRDRPPPPLVHNCMASTPTGKHQGRARCRAD